MSRVGVEQGSLIRLAQKTKTEIVRGKESSIELPPALAALAFGVSTANLATPSFFRF